MEPQLVLDVRLDFHLLPPQVRLVISAAGSSTMDMEERGVVEFCELEIAPRWQLDS